MLNTVPTQPSTHWRSCARARSHNPCECSSRSRPSNRLSRRMLPRSWGSGAARVPADSCPRVRCRSRLKGVYRHRLPIPGSRIRIDPRRPCLRTPDIPRSRCCSDPARGWPGLAHSTGSTPRTGVRHRGMRQAAMFRDSSVRRVGWWIRLWSPSLSSPSLSSLSCCLVGSLRCSLGGWSSRLHVGLSVVRFGLSGGGGDDDGPSTCELSSGGAYAGGAIARQRSPG